MPRLTPLLAEWAALNADAGPAEDQDQALADALLRACEPLSDEAQRELPGTPDDAAASLTERPFAGRAEGSYLPFEWLEVYCAALRLPLAELEDGWDISDGDSVYFCPRVLLADDPDSPDDRRAYVRVDQIRRWPEPYQGSA